MRTSLSVLGLLLTLRLAAIGTAAADVTTTATVLHQGGSETNPMLQRQTILRASALNAGTLTAVYRLEAAHPKLAAVFYVVLIGARSFATGHNARAIR